MSVEVGTATEFRFGRWRLLPAARCLLADNVPVAVGSRAFDVLLALFESDGELVTKDALLRQVWPGTIVEENNLQVQISALRKVFGKDAPQLIATVPGRGYCLTGALEVRGGAEQKAAPRPASALPPAAFDEPSRPSLAVLPFRNLSRDPDQEFFADGMVEDLITALSHIRWFFVIGRNSCFAYKGLAVPAPEIGRELGVHYVIEGAVRRAGRHVRINVELVETGAGDTVWAERFGADSEMIFDLQDRVVAGIVGAVEPKLCRAEIERGRRRPTTVSGAYENYLRAIWRMHPTTEANCTAALALLDRALAADPGFPLALAASGWCHTWSISQATLSHANRDRASRAIALAKAALGAAPDDPTVLAQVGIIFGYLSHRRQTALALVESAVALHPNSSLVRTAAGWVQLYEGNGEAAIAHFAEALRFDPLDPAAGEPFTGMCYAHLLIGRSEEAVTWGGRAVAASPDRASANRAFVAALGMAGRPAEAAVARLLENDPGFNLADYARLRAGHESRPLFHSVNDGLRRAGVPLEKAPMPR